MGLGALVLLVLVLLLVALFATIGVLHVFRGWSVPRLSSAGGNLAPVCSPEFLREVELLTRSTLSRQNSYQLLLNGVTFDRLWGDLRAAERSITIQQYYVEPGVVLDTLLQVLSERARAGVRVRVLFDAIGAKSGVSRQLEALRERGVDARIYRPTRISVFGRADSRLHSRGIVIDGEIGYTGGFGFADCWMGDGQSHGQWRDTNVRFAGPAVLQLQAAFATVWAEATGELLTGPLFFPERTDASTKAAAATSGLLHLPAGIGSTVGERFIFRSLSGATRRLFIANSYFVPDEHLVDLLVSLARAGVDVRILTAGELTDLPVTRWAGRHRYEELLSGGVRIFEYQPSMMHAKTFVVDGCWSSIGAVNLDVRSMSLNEENTFVATDEALGSELESIFFDDLSRSAEIELEKFLRRGLKERILERASATLTAVL